MTHTGEDIPGESPHGRLMAGQAPFDAAVFIASGQRAKLALVTERLRELFDPMRSSIVAGTLHDITDGEGHARLFFALRRRPELSPAEFHDCWFNHHAEAPRQYGHSPGYQQLHCDPAASLAAAEAAGLTIADFDGVALFKCSDFERIQLSLHHPSTRVPLEDEMRFIDHSRSVMGPFSPIH